MSNWLDQNSDHVSPVSEKSIAFLRLQADDLSEFVTNRYFERHPECRVEDQPRIRRLCKEDMNHHLGFILMAASTGNGRVFINYVFWLRQVLESRGLTLDHTEESLRTIAEYLDVHVESPDIETYRQLLGKGLAVLEVPTDQLPVPEHHSRIELPEAKDYTRAIVSGNSQLAGEITNREMSAGLSLVDLGVGIVQPAMYQVGNLWQSNKIGVAQEHMATAITQNILARAFMEAEFEDPNGRTAVLSCVPGNHHSLGLRMVSDALETAGWACEFLGADTPVEALVSFVDQKRPDLVALSVSMPEQLEHLELISSRLRDEFSSGRPSIVAGGLMLNVLMGLPTRTKVDEWFMDAKQIVEEKT